jgi:hypothetical protein
MDLKILWWTLRAVVGQREVAVHRKTGRLTSRAPRALELAEQRSAVMVEQKAS